MPTKYLSSLHSAVHVLSALVCLLLKKVQIYQIYLKKLPYRSPWCHEIGSFIKRKILCSFSNSATEILYQRLDSSPKSIHSSQLSKFQTPKPCPFQDWSSCLPLCSPLLPLLVPPVHSSLKTPVTQLSFLHSHNFTINLNVRISAYPNILNILDQAL